MTEDKKELNRQHWVRLIVQIIAFAGFVWGAGVTFSKTTERSLRNESAATNQYVETIRVKSELAILDKSFAETRIRQETIQADITDIKRIQEKNHDEIKMMFRELVSE